jgi:cytochrome c
MRVLTFVCVMAAGALPAGLVIAQSDARARLAAAGDGLDIGITDPDEIAAVCGGDSGLGEAVFVQNCAACHALEADVGHGTGPSLYGVIGRAPGTADGFDYSDAFTAAATEGWIWERQVMHAFVTDPQGFLPGSDHTTAIPDEQMRQDLLTYMRTAGTPPPPAPGTVVVPQEVLDMPGDVAYGEYLANECVGCHLLNGQSGGVPSITGWHPEPFITFMFEYRLGSRPNQTMVNIARRLSDEEIVALAAYFATIE